MEDNQYNMATTNNNFILQKNHSKALKAGLGYTIGNFLIKGINFLTLPVFSRILTNSEFGIYNIYLSYDAILSVVIGLAIHSSVRSAHYEFEGETDGYTSSVSLIYIFNAVFLLTIALLLGQYFEPVLGISKLCIILLIPYSFGSALLSLFNERISLNYSYKKYIVISLVSTLLNISLSLILILTLFRGQKDLGRILGSSIAILCVGLFILFSFFKKARPSLSKKYMKFAVKYSIPIVPHGISQVILNQFDRIMISKICDIASVGIYSLAANVKQILTIITNSIASVWLTWFYAEMEGKNFAKIKAYATLLTFAFLILAIGLIAISPELILILGGRDYIQGKYVVIPMIVEAFILFVYAIIVPIEYYVKQTKYVMFGTIISAILNIILNYIFINIYGFYAAAYTTLFSYIIYLIIHIIISKTLFFDYIVSVKNLIVMLEILSVIAVFCTVFSNYFITRYIVCIVIIAILLFILRKEYIKVKKIYK